MTRGSKIALLVIMLITILGVGLLAFTMFGKGKSLPVLGEEGHEAGAFSFTNQNGQTLTEKDVEGKITVVEYFFTTCPGICIRMGKNLTKVYAAYEQAPDFAILSHTVNPEHDSANILKAYAEKMNVKTANWQFLTGDKYQLYKAARQDYLLGVEDTDSTGTWEDFIHTPYVSLLDKQRRIRGFYDATDSVSIDLLIKDIARLRKEEK